MKTLTPAAYVVKLFGGYHALARIVGRNPATVYRWVHPRRKKTKGGTIPAKSMRLLYDLARKEKLDLTLLDLVYGRKSTNGN